jgi:hypothetical protein
MKTKFIPVFIAIATLCAVHAQTTATAPGAENRFAGRSTATLTDQQNELQAAKDKLATLKLKYTDQHPEIVAAKNRIAQLEGLSAYESASSSSAGGGGSVARFGQRLQSIVRRGGSMPAGSIIITSPMAQFKIDALSEDLAVINYIFTRDIERTFGEKGTEYKLGVPITMRGERVAETSYVQDYGVLVKLHVPFAVVQSGLEEKKTGPAATPDSDWEKARRAVFGGGDDDNASAERMAPYDETLVNVLKKLIFDALKSAANIRHLEDNQSITVVVIGRPNNVGTAGEPLKNPDPRSTILTVRVTKAQADAAKKDPEGNDLAKQAAVVAYLDAVNATAPSGNTGFGGYGGGGAGMSGYGGYVPSSGVAR